MKLSILFPAILATTLANTATNRKPMEQKQVTGLHAGYGDAQSRWDTSFADALFTDVAAKLGITIETVKDQTGLMLKPAEFAALIGHVRREIEFGEQMDHDPETSIGRCVSACVFLKTGQCRLLEGTIFSKSDCKKDHIKKACQKDCRM